MHAWKNGSRDVQKYLIPLTMDMDQGHVESLLRYQKELLHFGIEIEALSPSCVSISGAPTLLSDSALVAGLEKLARRSL